MTADRELLLDGRSVRLTSLDRVLWPRTGFTKGDLVDYYLAVASVLLPHLAGRPLTLGRWPQGVEGRGFAQTECRGRPDWLRTLPLRLRDGTVRNYCLVDDTPSLAWVANLAAIELHTYHFQAGRPDEPDVVVLDLDPGPGSGLVDACRVGLLVREQLEGLGLPAFAKTSGGLGLHVYAPLEEPRPGEWTRELARGVAARLATSHADTVTSEQRPAARRRRVLVDWLQSEPRRSTVAPYSLRAGDVPRVSMPVEWQEVEQAVASGDPSPLRFAPGDALHRVEALGDPFSPLRGRVARAHEH
jgi:bifunctional non-homologous end joining protein LigD